MLDNLDTLPVHDHLKYDLFHAALCQHTSYVKNECKIPGDDSSIRGLYASPARDVDRLRDKDVHFFEGHVVADYGHSVDETHEQPTYFLKFVANSTDIHRFALYECYREVRRRSGEARYTEAEDTGAKLQVEMPRIETTTKPSIQRNRQFHS